MVDRGWLVSGSWGGLVDWSWGRLVCWGRLVGRGGLVGRLVLWILGLALVPHISNIARVAIGHIVGDNLGAAVGKNNTVFAQGGVSVPFLILGEVGSGVRVGNSILISIDSWGIFIGWGGLVRSWLVGRSRLVSGGWGISWWTSWGSSGNSSSSDGSSKSLKANKV